MYFLNNNCIGGILVNFYFKDKIYCREEGKTGSYVRLPGKELKAVQ
jgi:hypothetical protein